jgi:beta-galactosidase
VGGPKGLEGRLCFGGDWNPEQWPERVWREDIALMRDAGVNLVSVGVFSWARLEPAPRAYAFGWLDQVLDALDAGGIKANLATPTASPPPWFSLAHPDALPLTAEGVRLAHGSRDTYCAAAPAYRDAARRIASALAERYAGHPALAAWHVHNEYGTVCYCDHAAAAFRRWLRERYPDLDALNDAWGTAFWSQHYGSWNQVLPPRATQWLPNPHQVLDYRRCWSDELRSAFREQRDILRAATRDVPVTTNFAFGDWVPVDHRRFAADVDLVALDAYPVGSGIVAEEQTAFLADLARHWAGGRPWLLMEQAPGTIRVSAPEGIGAEGTADGGALVPKAPGRMARLSASYLARGSRGVMFFQWRASAAGAEMFHSGIVPHAGPQTRIFTEVRELGALLPRLAEVAEAPVVARVGIAWDAESWWALRQPDLPSDQLDYLRALHRAHRGLWRRQVTADFVDLAGDLSPYRLVLVPSHYLASDAVAASVRRYVAGGGHLVVWYFSGVADAYARMRLGGYPGAFREVLGVRVEEFHPLPAGARVALSDGTAGTLWSEHVQLAGAEPLLWYAEGALAGLPAVTRHQSGDACEPDRERSGEGLAWYVSTELADDAYARLLDDVLATAGVAGGGLPPGVEVVDRRAVSSAPLPSGADNPDETSWRFVLNHTGAPAEVPAAGVELVSEARVDGALTVAPGGFAVIRSDGVPNRPLS